MRIFASPTSLFLRSCLVLTLGALPLSAQAVRLALKPRAGDTLILRIEQQTELIGSIIGPARDSSITVKTSMLLFARAVVQRADSSGAVIVGVADSMRTGGSPGYELASDSLDRAMAGKRVYMRLHPDGSSELINADASLSRVVSALLAEMPATMPKNPVNVGESWTREVPVALEQGAPPRAFRTTFRLDSLSTTKQMAYISMRGTLVEQAERAVPSAASKTSGDMRGRMTLDRARGWIIDSVATITLKALVQRPIESRLPPMNLEIRITQQMRTLNPH